MNTAGGGDTPTYVVVQGSECIGRGTGGAGDDHILHATLGGSLRDKTQKEAPVTAGKWVKELKIPRN